MRQGRVAINKQVVTKLGTRVGPHDEVTVDGRPVVVVERRCYILLNKPPGYLTTAADPFGRPTVLHLVPSEQRIYPVGRLDVDSEGLLLLTDDGELAYRLTHPRFALDKEYLILVDADPSVQDLASLREGVLLDGRRTAPAQVERVRRDRQGTWLRVVIHEGRKRQIRRMAEAVGLKVLRLKRIRVGPLELGNLPSGHFRHLTSEEVERLKKSA